MKISNLPLLALLPFIAAQAIDGLPECANSCALSGISSTGCSPSDIKCVCGADSFIKNTETCVRKACNQTDQDNAIKFAGQLCAANGVTLPPPSPTPAPASSTASGGSAAAAATSKAGSTSASSQTSEATSSAPPSSSPTGAGVALRDGVAHSLLGGLAALAWLAV